MEAEALKKHGNSDVNKEAENLETRIAELKKRGMGLTTELFIEIARWKLRSQYNRIKRHRNNLLIAAVPEITRIAFHDYPAVTAEKLLQFRTEILITLPSVRVGQASAILGLAFPDDYCVIDYRGWRQLFPDHTKTKKSLEQKNGTPQVRFTISDYWQYIQKVKELARQLDWSVRKTDTAIWDYDREMNRK